MAIFNERMGRIAAEFVKMIYVLMGLEEIKTSEVKFVVSEI
jgi:hypothetical protein